MVDRSYNFTKMRYLTITSNVVTLNKLVIAYSTKMVQNLNLWILSHQVPNLSNKAKGGWLQTWTHLSTPFGYAADGIHWQSPFHLVLLVRLVTNADNFGNNLSYSGGQRANLNVKWTCKMLRPNWHNVFHEVLLKTSWKVFLEIFFEHVIIELLWKWKRGYNGRVKRRTKNEPHCCA